MFLFRMTDDSKFVLNYEVSNARAALAAGRFESGEFNEKGFKWTAAIQKSGDDDDEVDFTLRCNAITDARNWTCEGEVCAYWLQSTGKFDFVGKTPFCFDENNSVIQINTCVDWGTVISQIVDVMHRAAFKLRVNIISSTRNQPIAISINFSAPNNRSDVVLKIGEKKLHVSKELLSLNSPVFEAMFFGDFAEKGKDEVEIKDIVYEEFLDFLQVIYLETEITDHTIPHILKLSDFFQMERLYNLSKKHLTHSKTIDAMKKLLLADQYKLDSVREHCLQSFTSIADLSGKLKSSPDSANFSSEMKSSIFDRIVQLKLH